MTFLPCADLSAAAWLTGSDLPWERLVTLGPAGLPAHARVRQLPDPDGPGRSESDVRVDASRLSESEQARAVLRVLGRHTGTPEDCYACIWDGWGTDLPPAEVVLPHRAYALFRGPLAELRGWAPAAPRLAFVWPADHAWCVTHDVDPHWMGVGTGVDAVAELLAQPGLDVVVADPDRAQPRYDGATSGPSDGRMPERYRDADGV